MNSSAAVTSCIFLELCAACFLVWPQHPAVSCIELLAVLALMYHAFGMLDQAFAASLSVGQENDIFCSPYLTRIPLACCQLLYKCFRAWDSNESHICTAKEQTGI